MKWERVVLPDGSVGHKDPTSGRIRRYTYQRKTDRVYQKTDGNGTWHNGQFLRPVQFAPDETRVMPPTRPDSDADDHRRGCRCEVCRRPNVVRAKELARAEAYLARLKR